MFQLRQPDVNQELYGLPAFLAALNATHLNEAAALFRGKYYGNASHAGFISTRSVSSSKAISVRSRTPRGHRGATSVTWLLVPHGKADGIKLLAEVAAKGECLGIKNTTRGDILAEHRVPPQLFEIQAASARRPRRHLCSFRGRFSRSCASSMRYMISWVELWLGQRSLRFDHRHAFPKLQKREPPVLLHVKIFFGRFSATAFPNAHLWKCLFAIGCWLPRYLRMQRRRDPAFICLIA